MYRSDFKLEKSTYYVLDASGNVMATYDKILDNENSRVYFKLEERHIYGSSRVGVRNSGIDLLPLPTQNYSMKSVHYSIGSRTYELSNQLPSVLPSAVGNVLSVISDTAKGSHAVNVIPQFTSSTVISEMRADIRVAQDYSPFGVTLDGRNFTVDEKYRYGFGGKEGDAELKGEGNSYDYGVRMYDSRLGRFLSVDPKASKYPSHSPYNFAVNNPILFEDDGNGPIIGWIMSAYSYDKETNIAKVEYTINVQRTIYVVNNSKMNLSVDAQSAIANNIKNGYGGASFSYVFSEAENRAVDSYMDEQYSHIPENASVEITIKVNFSATVQFVKSVDQITDPQATIIEMVNDLPITDDGFYPKGHTWLLSDAVQIVSEYISPQDINLPGFSLKGHKTSIHELLHDDGATDLYKYKDGKLIKNDSSMMGSGENRNLANKTKSEIAFNYFLVTRWGNNLENGKKGPSTGSNLGVSDAPGR